MLKSLMIAGVLVGLGATSPALAADNAMQVCGAKYRAAKTAKTIPAGQTWPQFLAQCRGTLPKTTAATTPAPAPATAKPAAAKPMAGAMAAKAPMSAPGKSAAPRVAGQASPAQIASRSRLTQCSKNYQADKAANKLAGQTWPKYYSACNTRLKG